MCKCNVVMETKSLHQVIVWLDSGKDPTAHINHESRTRALVTRVIIWGIPQKLIVKLEI